MLSVFNYLKRIFSWADETPRKRRASNDLTDIYYVNPKKHCKHQARMNYNELEEDDGVEIISEYISPSARREMMMNGSHNLKAASCTRRSRAYCENDSFQSLAATSRIFRPPTTLMSTAMMLDKKKYNDMLQSYLPEKEKEIRIMRRESEKEPIQEVEIIELDKRSVSKPRLLLENKNRCRQPIAIVQLDEDVVIEVANNKRTTEKQSKAETKSSSEIRVNSFRDQIANSKFMQPNLTDLIANKYNSRQESIKKLAKEQERDASAIAIYNQMNRDAKLSKYLENSLRLCDSFLDDQLDEDDQEEPELPKLTPQMLREVNRAWSGGSLDEVLVTNFGLSIKRRDMQTLANLNWLNDEVINFYTNLLIERGKLDKFPNVHAMNTFFYPKLLQSGHSSLKRWTRKVDIFSMDLIVVPVHLGIHWCMSIIDFRDKSIRYYDSMGGNNQLCLNTLRKYLEDESLDKKKQSYNTKDWTMQIVKSIPQQMNGSDCGVFSCMFAEYITANKKITFTQNDMQYFRHKMVYEILHSKLL